MRKNPTKIYLTTISQNKTRYPILHRMSVSSQWNDTEPPDELVAQPLLSTMSLGMLGNENEGDPDQGWITPRKKGRRHRMESAHVSPSAGSPNRTRRKSGHSRSVSREVSPSPRGRNPIDNTAEPREISETSIISYTKTTQYFVNKNGIRSQQ